MTDIAMNSEDATEELAQVLAEIEADREKPTCDLPGCEKRHNMKATIRIAQPRHIDLHFCSEEHKQEATVRWGF